MTRCTRTYAVLELSRDAFDEIEQKLKEAGYEHAFDTDPGGRRVIDMNGIGVAAEAEPDTPAEPVTDWRPFYCPDDHM